MFCKYCGAELEGDALFCPSCGKRIALGDAAAGASTAEGQGEKKRAEAPPSAMPQGAGGDKGKNAFCVAGFVLAILSFFFNYGGLVGIAAVVVCAVGLSAAKKEGQGGRSLAVVGLVLSAVHSLGFFMRLLEYSLHGRVFYSALDGLLHWLDDIL